MGAFWRKRPLYRGQPLPIRAGESLMDGQGAAVHSRAETQASQALTGQVDRRRVGHGARGRNQVDAFGIAMRMPMFVVVAVIVIVAVLVSGRVFVCMHDERVVAVACQYKPRPSYTRDSRCTNQFGLTSSHPACPKKFAQPM